MKPYFEFLKARGQEKLFRKKYELLDSSFEKILANLRKSGFYVWENFYTPDECDSLCSEIDQKIEEHSANIWRDENDADNRIFGAEKVSDSIRKFNTDERLTNLACTYLEAETVPYLTMAGRIRSKEGQNLGSGQGWHRDTVYIQQFKSIIYLTDVNENNGPFQYLEGSHAKSTIFEFNKKYGIGIGQNRISDKEVDAIVQDENYPLVEFSALKGTMILADTSGIHRGKPLLDGDRYALTNYFYQTYFLADNVRRKYERISVA